MKLPKVSVVTITYGHEKYITETLDGVLMQQYHGPVEFIIANDNSPDATDEVVKKYFLENPAPSNFEIKYTKHETNKGMMPNFIWALEQATGKYIALCEGDDYWTDPLKLRKQVGFLEENEDVVLSFHNRKIKDRTGKTYSAILNSRDKLIRDDKLLTYCPTQTMLFRNYTEFQELGFEDIFSGDFLLKAFLSTKGDFNFHSFEGAVYREHAGGVATSKSLAESRTLFIDSRLKILKRIPNINKKETYQSIVHLHVDLLADSLKKGSIRSSLSLIADMVMYSTKSKNFFKNIKLIISILSRR